MLSNISSAELPSLDEVRKEKLRRKLGGSLLEYVGAAWHVIEPATTFIPNWHIDAICDHLEAVTRGEIRNLLITIPPRNMKSLLVSVFWPTWVWTDDPSSRWLYSAYGQDLSKRDSLKCRRLIDSPWYQNLWGDVFSLTTDQNTKTRFENDKMGSRIGPFIRKRMRERKVYCLRRPYTSSRDKPTRARSIEARMSMGMVYLPKNAPWKDDLVSELLHFPAGVFDDQVDVLSLVGRMLDRLVPGRVPKEPEKMEARQPTLDELIDLQPKEETGFERI